MIRSGRAIVVLSVIALVGAGVWAGWRAISRRGIPAVQSQIVAPVPETAGFARAEGPRPLDFPADYGPHPDFQTEWWYYTGNAGTDDGRHFGYQLTFFRRALIPPTQREDRESDWATDQIYMAHFALTDSANAQHHAFERFSRGAAGLAGASSLPYRVWLEDWRVEQLGADPGIVDLSAAQEEIGIHLRLIDRKGPILQGDQGYSQKGPDPGNASYYYSQTRLETSGSIRVGGTTFQVDGLSWMDHEFSTSALAPGQIGWDWFALQLDDGTDLMVFQIRRSDGTIDPFSSGSLIGPGGETERLASDAFSIEVLDNWRSPRSGAEYPARWTIRVPSVELAVEVQPVVADQELNVSYNYWEGAVRLQGRRGDRPVMGQGYVELTGYAGSMQDQF